MRLTTLDIKGFKSFGDKVTIHFDKGVTAIVGPNGSGKSNVVDAMRWVLGEQKTRMLRSEKMENIIFNGTKNRKPANLAEVSLSFENTKNVLPTEYSTVTITRKLYRTGDSEYLLNGVSCRLKDITDLFLDTGIGSDSYSIIELKMIDEIINDRNNTIKMLFEEAAGISKYKVRKKQTLQKLEETDADLNRVNDLLYEIEKNLKTLESQAKKTERYYKLKEQYKELSTQLAVFNLASYKENFETLQAQEERQKDEKIAIDTQIDTKEAELQKLKLDNTDNERHLAASQKALNDKMALIRQKENDKNIKNERLKFLQDKEATLVNQLFSDKKYIDELQTGIKALSDDHEQEQKLLQQAENALRELKTIVDQAKETQLHVQTEINSLTKSFQQAQEESHRLEKTFAIQQTQRESLNKEIIRLKEETDGRIGEITGIEEQLNTVITQKETLEANTEGLFEREEDLNQILKTAEDKLKNTEEVLVSLNRRLDSKQNEYNLTKSLVDNLEGFPESIKYLKKNAASLKNAPLLSDIISCKQEYKTALENYLEPYLNYFVVNSFEEAYESVNLLNKSSQGRANFFVLDSIASPKSELGNVSNYMPALKVLDTDKKYLPLCKLLLHNVFFLPENADDSLPNSADGLVLIASSGRFVKTDSSVSGGSVGLFEGKRIGRAKNIELLATEINKIQDEQEEKNTALTQCQQQLANAKNELSGIITQKNGLQTEVNRISTQYATLAARKEQVNTFLLNNRKRVDDINAQLEQLGGLEADGDISFSEQLGELNTNKILLQQQLLEKQQLYNQANTSYTELTANYNQQNIAFLQLQNKVSTITRDLGYKKHQLDTYSQSIVTNSAELEKIKAQVTEILNAADESDDSIIALYEEKESLEKAVAEIETGYYKARGFIDETDTYIRELRKRKEQTDALAQSIKDKVTEIKLQLNSLKERLAVEFEVNIETIMEQEPDPELDEADLKDRVDKLRQQINNYGPINPMAIEAYNEINERYTFIVTQKDDLLKAKESLLQTINEIDNTAKDKFMEAYTHIRENFIKVFRSLFSEEDNCDLVIADPLNPLDSEINIIAQPKGKRPLSINQLSGGEKTLTATALLFSIYLLKPAPFCIFDEVDAPLDDTNIDKFNKIIKRFSEESQFIVITHNKRTMASTDIIYGVTMVELGITQVVPVDMREVA